MGARKLTRRESIVKEKKEDKLRGVTTKSGRRGLSGRMNLLEEVGRIDSEKMNPNRRAEKRRVVSELNSGYKNGGRVMCKGQGKVMKKRPTFNISMKRG